MDPAATPATPATPAGRARRWAPLVAGFVAIVAVVTASVTITVSLARRSEAPAPAAVKMAAADMPLDLATIAAPIAARYSSAHDHEDHFRQVRCFCGCETFAVAHESLWQCFVRPDGQAEAHAAGCGVCLAEADVVADRTSAGTPIGQVAAEIVAQFGPRPDLNEES